MKTLIILLLIGVFVLANDDAGSLSKEIKSVSLSPDTLEVDGRYVQAIITAVNYLEKSKNKNLRIIPKRLELYAINYGEDAKSIVLAFDSKRMVEDGKYFIGEGGPDGVDVRVFVSKDGKKVQKQLLFE